MTSPAVVRRWSGSGLDPPPGPAAPVRRGGLGPSAHGGEVADRGLRRETGPERAVPGRAVPGRATAAGVLGSVVQGQVGRIGAVAPLGAAFLTVLVLQAGLAPHLALRQAAPDLLLVSVVAVAIGRGSRAGAGFGFASGLGADLFLATPLGTSALAFTVVGHVAGQRMRRPAGPDMPGARRGSGPEQRPAPASARRRRRSVARRAAVRRSIALTGIGVGGGHLAAAVTATALGGVPFPGGPGLVHIAAIGGVSAPFGPLALAALRRLPGDGR